MFYPAKGRWGSGTGRFVLEPGFVTPSSLTRVNLVPGVDFLISMSHWGGFSDFDVAGVNFDVTSHRGGS